MKKVRVIYLITFVIPMIVFLLLWILLEKSEKMSNLYLNLFTTFLSVNLVIFVIDVITEISYNKRIEPITASFLREVQILTSQFVGEWVDIYKSTTKSPVETIDELFSSDIFEEMLKNFDLTKTKPLVYPEITWFKHLNNQHKEFTNKINKILLNYSLYIEPDIYRRLYNLGNHNMMLLSFKLMYMINLYDQREGFNRPKILQSYFPDVGELSDDFNEILDIVEYVNVEYKKYKKLGYDVYLVNKEI